MYKICVLFYIINSNQLVLDVGGRMDPTCIHFGRFLRNSGRSYIISCCLLRKNLGSVEILHPSNLSCFVEIML